MKRLAAAALAAGALHLLLFSVERDQGGFRNITPPAAETVTIALVSAPLPSPPATPPAVTPPDPPAAPRVPESASRPPQTVAPAAMKTPLQPRPVPRPPPAKRWPAAETAARPAPDAPDRASSDGGGDESRPPAENPPPAPAEGQGASAASGPVGALRPPPAPVLESATPDYDRNPPPGYPRRARQLGFEGTVLLDVAVNAEGAVDAVAVAASSGYAMLDEAALDAVRHWVFKPARREGRPIADRVQVPVRFVLSASSAAGK